VPQITRHAIEYSVPVLERAIDELRKAGAEAAALNLGPVLVCMRALGGWYDDAVPPRRRRRRHRLETV